MPVDAYVFHTSPVTGPPARDSINSLLGEGWRRSRPEPSQPPALQGLRAGPGRGAAQLDTRLRAPQTQGWMRDEARRGPDPAARGLEAAPSRSDPRPPRAARGGAPQSRVSMTRRSTTPTPLGGAAAALAPNPSMSQRSTSSGVSVPAAPSWRRGGAIPAGCGSGGPWGHAAGRRGWRTTGCRLRSLSPLHQPFAAVTQ